MQIEAIGYAAAVLSTVCWMPQALRVIATRDTRSISLLSQSLFATAILLWIIYGLLTASWPVFACNIIAIFPVVITLAVKIRNVRQGER
ncbi:MAG: PQ-loop domain-containing transporter [Novosphingobium sp.]